MKPLISFLVLAAFTSVAAAQPAPGGAEAPPASTKPKPYSPSDTRVYLTIAAGMQFQLIMSMRLRGRYKESDPGIAAFGLNLHKACTELWTPGVDAAMQHGVEGTKIPHELSKNDQAVIARLGTLKDDKKWQLGFFELFAKESKKHAAEAEKLAKSAQDAELKEFAGKAAALLTAQAGEIEVKFKELKSKK